MYIFRYGVYLTKSSVKIVYTYPSSASMFDCLHKRRVSGAKRAIVT
jgi:hypothetical protein